MTATAARGRRGRPRRPLARSWGERAPGERGWHTPPMNSHARPCRIARVPPSGSPGCGAPATPAEEPSAAEAMPPSGRPFRRGPSRRGANPWATGPKSHPRRKPRAASEPEAVAEPVTEELSWSELDRRGDGHLKAGRFVDAIADFDAAVALRVRASRPTTGGGGSPTTTPGATPTARRSSSCTARSTATTWRTPRGTSSASPAWTASTAARAAAPPRRPGLPGAHDGGP